MCHFIKKKKSKSLERHLQRYRPRKLGVDGEDPHSRKSNQENQLEKA